MEKSEPQTVFRHEPGDWFPYGWIAGAPTIHVSGRGRVAVSYGRESPGYGVDPAVCCVSEDNGQNWRVAERSPDGLARIIDTQRHFRPARLADGVLLDVGVWAWADFPESERDHLLARGHYLYDEAQGNRPGVISVFYTLWSARSTDQGQSWNMQELALSGGTNWDEARRYGDALLLRDGTFVKAYWAPGSSCGLVRTADGGANWSAHVFAPYGDVPFCYPCLTEAADSRLVAMVQSLEQDRLWMCASTDGGRTWSAITQTSIRGGNPGLVTTHEGKVVALYARESPQRYPEGTGVFACVSHDGGSTWDTQHEITLWDNHGQAMLTMPGGAVLPNGQIIVVFPHEARSVLSAVRFRA